MLNILSWLDWVGLAIALILLCVLVFLLWRRLKPEGRLKFRLGRPTTASLRADRLTGIWQRFVKAIPWGMRRSTLSAPLFLVLGESGSGKTALINEYSHWQGQNYRFHPSLTDDPLLQIYLGAKSLVLEISATLLYDASPAAYRAIRRLWRQFPVPPVAVAVIDAGSLLNPQPDRLRQSGQALFGKLEVFAELEGEPLPLVVVLGQMEKVQGFNEFCDFLSAAGIPLQLDYPDGDGIQRLKGGLDGFAPHLQRALLTRPAQDYLSIVKFLAEAPHLLEALAEYLRQAGLGQGVAPGPVVRLCLTSEQHRSFGCQPFRPLPTDEPARPVRFDSRALPILWASLAGLAYLIGSYYYQKAHLTSIVDRLGIINVTPKNEYAEKISPLFDYDSTFIKDPLMAFMPNFFHEVDKYIDLTLVRGIRKNYLLPELQKVQLDQDAPFKTNYILALLYATASNEPGKLLLNRLKTAPTEDMIKNRVLIQDYITNNSHTEELDRILNSYSYAQPRSVVEDVTPWLIYFRNLQVLLKKPFIREVELADAQKRAREFLEISSRISLYQNQDIIVNWLNTHTQLRFSTQSQYFEQAQLRQEGIYKLLNFVKNLSMEDTNACHSSMAIKQCLDQIQAVADAKSEAAPSRMQFTLQGEEFSFQSGQWLDLLLRSRITLMLRYAAFSHRTEGWAFFDTPSPYPDVDMALYNEDNNALAGTGRIDGRLTADAFEQQVKPVLADLADVVDKLPVNTDEKKRFEAYINSQLRTYSERYVSAYLNYYRQLQIRIDTPVSLKYVLAQLQLPNSPLMMTLLQVKNNTALTLPASPAFKPFAEKLAVFRPVQRLMAEQGGAYPEFAKYQLMMQQMQDELESTEPYVPKKSGDDAAGLKSALTPMGRVAWGMLLKDDGSYLKLVKAWLQSLGLGEAWQQPFLTPVQKVQDFGLSEIQQSVDGIWSDLWNSNVLPMLDKFPFMPDAGKGNELPVEELSKVLHPKQGGFWVTFHQYLDALCVYGGGVWVKRQELADALALPSDMLPRLNAAQQFTAMLWDSQGTPKPLLFSVKPTLLPAFDRRQMPKAPLVSLSYLRNGGDSVLGFNQQAMWQKFSLEWWTAQQASVGLEFRNDQDVTKAYADITVADSPWNFFRLLQQGQSAGNERYRWYLAHPDYPQQKLNLEFTFQNNPWSVFADLAGS